MAASTSQHTNAIRPLCLLALDGGGVRGYSELIILHQLMLKIKEHTHRADIPKPWEIFDLIGGTSTGGIIALMLGRLKMSTDQAMAEYENFAKDVFGKPKRHFSEGRYSATTLEKMIKSTVGRSGLQSYSEVETVEEMRLLEDGGSTPHCKVFVSAANARVLDGPRLFRSYQTNSAGEYPDMTIWQAARATSAAPTFFKRLKIGPANAQEEFIDGGIGSNNPTKLLLKEAADIFGSNHPVACVISIGTGIPKLTEFRIPGIRQKLVPLDLAKALGKIATDCEKIEKGVAEFFSSTPRLYFRFNVSRGLEDVPLEEWNDLGNIRAKTIHYLENDVLTSMKQAVVSVCERREKTLASNLHPKLKPPHRKMLVCNVPTIKRLPDTLFIPRPQILEHLNRIFHGQVRGPHSIKVAVLQAMGGQGKTQIALNYCDRARDTKRFRYDFILWADAEDSRAIEVSFKLFSKQLQAAAISSTEASHLANARDESSLEITKRLVAESRFLLVVDSLDDPSKIPGIKSYLEFGGQGDIIITSRNEDAFQLGDPLVVPNFSVDEGRLLLSARSSRDGRMDSPDDTKMLVEALGGLPLGLAQAAQYIRARKLSYRNFLDIFHEKREILQDKELPGFWEYTKNPGGSESEANKQLRIGIQTTWVMSFEYLESCEDGASKCHLLTLSAYLDTKSISGAAFDPWLSRVARAIQDSDSVQPEVDETTVNPTKTRIIERSTWARPLLDEDRRNVVFLDFLADAQKIGLISIKEHGPNGPVYWIHALVARWLRRQYDDDYILEAAFLTSELNRSLYKSNPNTDLIYEAIRHSTSCINLKTHLRNLTFGVGDLRDVGLALCLRANFAGNQSLEVYDILRFAANEIARLEPSMSRLLHHSDGDYSMSSILFDMGSIKQARGENVEAVKDLLRAKQAALSEDDADIFIGIVCGLIDLYVAQNDNEKLVSIYDDLPKKLGNRLSPFFLSLHDILSYTLHHLKPRPNLSSKAVERLLNSTQDMPEIITRYYLAMSYSFTGDYEQVITQLELVLHSNTQMNDFRERERDLAFLRVASSLLRTVALHRNNRISHPEMVHQTVTYITESEQLSDIEKSRLTSFMLVIFKGSIIDLVDVIHLYLWKLFAETENPEGSIIHSANALKFSLYMAILEGTLSYQQLKDAKALIKVNGPLLESKQEHSLNQALALGYKVLGELEESI